MKCKHEFINWKEWPPHCVDCFKSITDNMKIDEDTEIKNK